MKNITTYLDKISEEYYQKFMSRVNSSEKISIEDQLKTIKEIICCSSLQYDLQDDSLVVYYIVFGMHSSDDCEGARHSLITKMKNGEQVSLDERLHAIQDLIDQNPEYWDKEDYLKQIKQVAHAINRIGYKSLKVSVKVEYEGKVLADNTVDINELFMVDIHTAIKNGKDPFEAISILADIGSRERMSHDTYKNWSAAYIDGIPQAK